MPSPSSIRSFALRPLFFPSLLRPLPLGLGDALLLQDGLLQRHRQVAHLLIPLGQLILNKGKWLDADNNE